MGKPCTKWIYNDIRWKRARKAALIRAAGQCEIRLPGCTIIATQGDHIAGLEEGGAPFDPNNIQAACKPCNVAKENNRRLGKLNTSRQW